MAKLIVGVTDLATTHPDLAKEWDFEKNTLKSTEITSGSGRKVWWLCKKGHSYKARVDNRTNGTGCPYCSGRQILKGYNDLATTHPDLAKEWDFTKNTLKPTEVSIGKIIKVWWICSNGHSYEQRITDRVKGSGCPYCSNQKVLQGYNDLATTHPDLIKEWDFDKNELKPTEVTTGSGEKVWWLCSKGHSWEAFVYSRINRGCPYCSGRNVIQGVTDLATTHPDLAKEWDMFRNLPLRPTEVPAGSKIKIWWKCKEGHSWQASLNNRTKGHGCPYCSGLKVIKRKTDLPTTNPELLKEWDFTKNTLKPTEVSAGSRTKVWWLCSKGHSWQAVVVSRTNGIGCPYCSGRNAIKGETDLPTTNPKLLKEWDYDKNIIKPTEIKAHSNKKVWWLCKNGHSWQAQVNSRTDHGSGCPYCSGSVSEKLTVEILSQLNINFKKDWVQKIGINNRKYDFHLSDYALCIEIDGIQHFEEVSRKFEEKTPYRYRKAADTQKNNYLLKHGIPLLRIPGLDTFNTRLSKINQPRLDESQFKDILKDIIQDFIATRKIPDEILEIYESDSETNYYQVALQMNKL